MKNKFIRRCFAKTGCLIRIDGVKDEDICPQGFPRDYHQTIAEASEADESDSDDGASDAADDAADEGLEVPEVERDEAAVEDSSHFDGSDDDATSADDRDFDMQLPPGWTPVEVMPDLLSLKGRHIMFRWSKEGWRKGIVKVADRKKLAKVDQDGRATHVVSYKMGEGKGYGRYPQELRAANYRWSEGAMAGDWVVVERVKNKKPENLKKAEEK